MQNIAKLATLLFSLTLLLSSCATTNNAIHTSSADNNSESTNENAKVKSGDKLALLVIGVSARNIVTRKAPYNKNVYTPYTLNLAKYSPQTNKYVRDDEDVLSYTVTNWPPEGVIKNYYYHIMRVKPGDYALLSAKVGNHALQSLAWESSTFSIKPGQILYVGNIALGYLYDEQKIHYRYIASEGTIADAELALARYLGVKENVNFFQMAPTTISCTNKGGAMKTSQSTIHGAEQACFVE